MGGTTAAVRPHQEPLFRSGADDDQDKTSLMIRLLRVVSTVALALFAIILAAIAALYVYEPTPAEGFAFSSAGEAMQLSDGRTLAYLDTGDPEGRPVFYFHGGPGSRLEALIFEELNRQSGIRMISTDRPGYGLSDAGTEHTYLDWAADITELADHLGIERFAVLGWSSGGPHAAAVAHEFPERLTVAAIVAGEGPYASDDYPQSVLAGDTFNASGANRLFIWSARNWPWLMRTLLRFSRILMFKDPVGLAQSSGEGVMSAKDIEFFARSEFIAASIEALRQGEQGATRDFTIERVDWPFELEDIAAPVLMFHGQDDKAVDPRVGEYVCARMPSCDEVTMFPGEGHSVVYYRYEDIIQAVLEVWE